MDPGFSGESERKPYYFAKISRKLHVNGENWTEREEGVWKILLCRSATGSSVHGSRCILYSSVSICVSESERPNCKYRINNDGELFQQK